MTPKITRHRGAVQSTAGGLHVSGNLRHGDIAVGSGIRFTGQPLQQLVRKQAHAIATGRRYLLIGTTGGDVLARGGLGNALNIVKGVGAEGTGQALHRKGATETGIKYKQLMTGIAQLIGAVTQRGHGNPGGGRGAATIKRHNVAAVFPAHLAGHPVSGKVKQETIILADARCQIIHQITDDGILSGRRTHQLFHLVALLHQITFHVVGIVGGIG